MGLSADMTTGGLRVGDVAGVGGARDEFCNTAVSSGRGRGHHRPEPTSRASRLELESLKFEILKA